jgi:ketosteroid isomerase-like protein
MTIKDIADDLVALCKAGKFDESGEKYWADDVVSVEAMTGDMARVAGKAAVRGKGEWWTANHEVHGFEITGPFVNGDQFVVGFKMDITPKATGERVTLDEVGLYTIKDGKIVEERFFY